MRTRWILALALTLLLTGCTGGGSTSAPGRITLRFQSLAWQDESVTANRELVKEWNATHPGIKVEYVQGSWDSVHDQLLTSFEGGEAPDIIHDASDDLADFAYGGYLTDLRNLLPARLKSQIPQRSWDTATFGHGVYGVPFLQEPRVLIANATWLKKAHVRIPTPEHPWTWTEFRDITRWLSGNGKYGVAWPLKEPVSATLNLSLSAGGEMFHRGRDGKVTVRFDQGDQVVPARSTTRPVSTTAPHPPPSAAAARTHCPVSSAAGTRWSRSASPTASRSCSRPPRASTGRSCPPRPSADGLTQGVSPQTLSIAQDSPHKKEAAEFIAFLLQPKNMVRLALGDWMLPTATQALKSPALHTAKNDWSTGTALADDLVPAPAQSVRGYPEWKDKVATPAFQEYYSGAITLRELRQRLEKDGNLVLARYQR